MRNMCVNYNFEIINVYDVELINVYEVEVSLVTLTLQHTLIRTTHLVCIDIPVHHLQLSTSIYNFSK